MPRLSKSNELRARDGDMPSRFVLPDVSPNPLSLTPPKGLDEIEREHWIELVNRMPWLREADSAAVRQACRYYAQIEWLHKLVFQQHPDDVKNWQPVTLKDAQKQYTALLSDLCGTISARAQTASQLKQTLGGVTTVNEVKSKFLD